MAKNVFYIGNLFNIAEYIYFNDDYKLQGIICEEDRINDELLTFSLARNILIYKVNKENVVENYINSQTKDTLFIVCSYGKRIKIENCLNHNLFNIHYSELPKYKGRHPTYWASVSNEKYLGISIHKMTANFDDGYIISQRNLPYYLWENEIDINHKLTKQVPFLIKDLNDYLDGKNNTYAKENNSKYYYKPITERDTIIDLSKDTPDLIFNKVRVQSRYEGAKLCLRDKIFTIFNLNFTQKCIQDDYEISDKLYIKFRNNICIASTKYKEIT